MKQTKVTFSNTRAGIYHLIENVHGNGIMITAQGLLELACWVEQHRRSLEHESKQENGHLVKYHTEDIGECEYSQREWRE